VRDDGRQMRWWGWGDPPEPVTLSEEGAAFLRSELGLDEDFPRVNRVELEDVWMREPALPEAATRAIRAVVWDENLRTDREARVRHAAGRSYPDLVRLRAGYAEDPPDAVVWPGDAGQVAAVLRICEKHGVAVVPFGGGTSVVGGVEPLRDAFSAVISLDLGRLDRLTTDPRSLTATIGAGLAGWSAEARLRERNLTLGHFPQSIEFASIGGYVATRSAGQASTGYGRIDDLVVGARMIAPAGEVSVRPLPASAAGPSLRELVVGSEGVLGVIVEATLAVRPRPPERRYEGWAFRDFAAGAEAFRALEQGHAAPDIARLSDEQETRLAMALSSTGSLTQRIGRAYLRARGRAEGCIAILGWEGEPAAVDRRAIEARGIVRAHGGVALGTGPGHSWDRTRYLAPYLRDELMDRGILVETLETATTWTGLEQLHDAVAGALREALAAGGSQSIVACHVSHLYPSGASLYFTFMARAQPGSELDQWRMAKEAASRAIVENGGTITHHHAIGRDHLPWMRDEVGELGLEILRAAKERLDPHGIMNPGKLLPPAGS
jgi:alkyldihydroxyacetonephosphate synthase